MDVTFDRLQAGLAANYYPEGNGKFLVYDWASKSWEESLGTDGTSEGPYIKCPRYSGPGVAELLRAALDGAPAGSCLVVWDTDPLTVGVIWSDRTFPAGGKSKFTKVGPAELSGAMPAAAGAFQQP